MSRPPCNVTAMVPPTRRLSLLVEANVLGYGAAEEPKALPKFHGSRCSRSVTRPWGREGAIRGAGCDQEVSAQLRRSRWRRCLSCDSGSPCRAGRGQFGRRRLYLWDTDRALLGSAGPRARRARRGHVNETAPPSKNTWRGCGFDDAGSSWHQYPDLVGKRVFAGLRLTTPRDVEKLVSKLASTSNQTKTPPT